MNRLLLTVSLVFLFVCFFPACGPGYTRDPIPQRYVLEAELKDIPAARFLGDQPFGSTEEDFQSRAATFKSQLESSGLDDEPIRYLAISGGGPDGAYGAGILCGWTEHGSRPEFQYVTGISTGALTAPFAFLGHEYDRVLKSVYTSVRTGDLVRERGLISAMFSDALSDVDGLKSMIAEHVDDEVVRKIGEQHLRGRRLYIGTTNLDLMEPVYWNVGAIAVSDRPDRAELVRSVMLASASIPAVFPPVYIKVVAPDGNVYDEMHVDGGAATQVFAYPLSLDLKNELETLGLNTDSQRLYVIRNAKIKPDYKTIEPELLSIAGRAVSALIRNQGIGDLFRIYLGCVRDEISFNLAYIPDDFDVELNEPFDPVYMSALFDLGYQAARDGYPWLSEPPGFAWPDKEKWPTTPQR